MSKLNSKGFTIIELLISTVVFSAVLLVITGAIIQFNRVYYKGVVTSKTQEAARAIVEDVSKTIQFSTGGVTGNGSSYCVGNKKYDYTIGQIQSATQPVLVARNNCTAPVDGTEMVGENMQLREFTIAEEGSEVVRVRVVVVYGNELDPVTGQCRPIISGGQYCALSTIEARVNKRL